MNMVCNECSQLGMGLLQKWPATNVVCYEHPS